MALIETMTLMRHEKTFAADGTIEHVKYAHTIERDGEVIQSVPHRIVITRSNPDQVHPMPDGTAKTTAEVVVEIDV